jgi:hypothetical protein
MSDMQISRTILEQLGGRRFVVMTGAHNLIGSDAGLSFRLPSRFATDGSNAVRVTLTGMDDYIVETLNIRGTTVKPCSYREGVYAENLQQTFTALTGLDTTIGSIRRAS